MLLPFSSILIHYKLRNYWKKNVIHIDLMMTLKLPLGILSLMLIHPEILMLFPFPFLRRFLNYLINKADSCLLLLYLFSLVHGSLIVLLHWMVLLFHPCIYFIARKGANWFLMICLILSGTTVKFVLEQDKAAFIRLIGVSILQSAANSFVAPSLR